MKAARMFWIAAESGYRAGLKQFRKRMTELRRDAANESQPAPSATPKEP